MGSVDQLVYMNFVVVQALLVMNVVLSSQFVVVWSGLVDGLLR